MKKISWLLVIGLVGIIIFFLTTCGKEVVVDSGSGGGGGNEVTVIENENTNTPTTTAPVSDEASNAKNIRITVKGTEVTVNEKKFKYDKDNDEQFYKDLMDYIESILQDDSTITASFEEGDYNVVNRIQSQLDSLGVEYTLEKE